MTKFSGRKLTGICLAAVLCAGIAAAQRPMGFRNWAREMVERLAMRLSLNESQKQQALAIYSELEESTRPLERKIGELRISLREAVKNQLPESQIDQIASTLGALLGQVAALEAKADAKFYSILTPEQREKWAAPFGGRGSGPRPPVPPPPPGDKP